MHGTSSRPFSLLKFTSFSSCLFGWSFSLRIPRLVALPEEASKVWKERGPRRSGRADRGNQPVKPEHPPPQKKNISLYENKKHCRKKACAEGPPQPRFYEGGHMRGPASDSRSGAAGLHKDFPPWGWSSPAARADQTDKKAAKPGRAEVEEERSSSAQAPPKQPYLLRPSGPPGRSQLQRRTPSAAPPPGRA